jgi:hypothetical protein
MTSTITKIVLSFAAVIVVVAAGISLAMTLGNTAEAATSCSTCGYSQSDYYTQNTYYTQGSYSTYKQADYYTQNSYYTQGSYTTYKQADYYTQNTYYTQGSYTTYKQADYYTQNTYYTQGSYTTYNQASYVVPELKCISLTPSKTLVNKGEKITLTWKTENAASGRINPGDIAISPVNSGSTEVTVNDTTTYTLTVKKADKEKSCTAKVEVKVVEPELKCVSLTPSKTLVEKGEKVTLTWKTENAESGKINPGDISISPVNTGSTEVTVNDTTTYTLTVKKAAIEKSCTAKVEVKTVTYTQGSYSTYSQGSYSSYSQGSYSNYSQGSYGGGGSKSPRCDLDISAKTIKKGKTVTIKWNTTNATDILLKDNHGKTLIDTDDLSSSDKKDFLDGKIDVKPVKDTTYTLIAERGSKDKTCKVEVEVEDEILVLETRDQKPFVQGISLTHVPYTGFEAGPVLTFIFYMLLTLWALFVAYVLVIKKKVS